MKKLTFSRVINALINRLPGVRAVRAKKRYQAVFAAWQRVASNCSKIVVRQNKPQKVLIVPCDPYTLTGSRGDEAMLEAFIDLCKKKYSGVQIAMITASDKASDLARMKGCYPLQLWTDPVDPEQIMNGLENYAADVVVGLGADVMDGYYSSYNTLVMLIHADLSAKLGSHVSFLGFSFNASPSPELQEAFKCVDANVRFNLRDPVSLQRFQDFTHAEASLVADMAFCLSPHTEDQGNTALAAWVHKRKADGDIVIGYNIQPLLLKNAKQGDLNRLIDASVAMITNVSSNKKISWVLLPHDFRGGLGDNVCLGPIADKLNKASLNNYYHVDGEPSAALLKAMSGLLDGVITGRMHLAIAALGMGVPVLGLTYQDKFHGLFKHFKLPEWLLLSPQIVFDVPEFTKRIETFLQQRCELQASVQQSVKHVRELSEKNIDFNA